MTNRAYAKNNGDGLLCSIRSELIPTGNTTENCQNNATFVSYDPAKARNEFARSNCTYTREFDVTRPQELLIGQLLRNVRNLRVKPDILKNKSADVSIIFGRLQNCVIHKI
jgi:hypothetical protein